MAKKSDEFKTPLDRGSIETGMKDLDQRLFGKALAGYKQSSAIEKKMESINSYHHGINSTRSLTEFAQSSSIQKALESFHPIQHGINSAWAEFAQPSSIQKALESFQSFQHGINSAWAATEFAQPSSIQKTLESFHSFQYGINSARALAEFAQPSSIQKALESFQSFQHGINSAWAATEFAQSSAIQKTLDSFNSHQREINTAIGSIANLPAMENMLASFATASSKMWSDQNTLSSIFASIERAEFSSINLDNIEDDLTTAANQFNNADNVDSLHSIFTNLPPLIQAILFFIMLQVFLPLITNISANLLTPVVESYLQDNNLADREKVKQIKEIPLYMNDVNTKGLRFIIGNNVRLRSKPSTKSEILDELVLGQIVTILSKDRNWIEVTYTYEDGEVMAGWVFTRYTAKFVR